MEDDRSSAAQCTRRTTRNAPSRSDADGEPHRHYRDATSRLLGYVCRFDLKSGGKDFRPLTYCKSDAGRLAWRWQSWPAPRPLFGLDRLAKKPKARVVVCEGEKTAEAVEKLLPDHVAVTS